MSVKESHYFSLTEGESCRECVVRGQGTTGKAGIVSRDWQEPLLEVIKEKPHSE